MTLREKCPNTGKYEPEITRYLDTFHAVLISIFLLFLIAQNSAETVPFRKISTPGNQVKLRYFTQWLEVGCSHFNWNCVCFNIRSMLVPLWIKLGFFQYLKYVASIISKTASASELKIACFLCSQNWEVTLIWC